MDIARIKKLAGLRESFDDDEQDRLDDERRLRETKVRQAIQMAFAKIGLVIAEDGLLYMEDSDREAYVTLDDTEVDLDLLMKLKQSGLAAKYQVHAGKHQLDIVFNVAPDMDNVVLPQVRR
jgi:hypothetical protein